MSVCQPEMLPGDSETVSVRSVGMNWVIVCKLEMLT